MMPDIALSLAEMPSIAISVAPIVEPAVTPQNEAGSGAMMVLSLLLALVALAAVGNVVSSRRQVRKVTRSERSKARNMRELLRTLRMAESIAGIGVWQYDPASGVQQWSDGLKRLFGIEEPEAFVEGDAETLLFSNNVNLVGKVN